MSNGTPPSYNIGRAVADGLRREFDQIKFLLGAIEGSLVTLVAQQQETLAETKLLKEAELARAEAQLYYAQKTKKSISDKRDAAEGRHRDQERKIQDDYDKIQHELIKNFAESVKADTESIDRIKSEYREIHDLEQSMLEDMEHLKLAHSFNYLTRKMRLSARTNGITANVDSFLGSRTQTARLIDSLQTRIPASLVREPTTLYAPFWVVGITDGSKEDVYVFSVQERFTPGTNPTRNQPFVDHLRPHEKSLGLWNFSHFFENEDAIEKAREHSVQPDREKLVKDINRYLGRFLDRSNTDHTSTFLSAFQKFALWEPTSPDSGADEARQGGIEYAEGEERIGER